MEKTESRNRQVAISQDSLKPEISQCSQNSSNSEYQQSYPDQEESSSNPGNQKVQSIIEKNEDPIKTEDQKQNQGSIQENHSDIEEVLNYMGQSYEQYFFSQKFKDQSIENEYQLHIQQSIISLGKITLWQAFVGVALVIGFSLYRLILTKSGNPSFYPVLYIYGASFTLLIIHYFLARKYILAANLFSAVQTLQFFICSTELMWLINSKIDEIDGQSTNTAVLASFAMLSYDQNVQLFTYILGLIHFGVRNYYHIAPLRYARVQLYQCITIMFIYFFARAFNQRDRDNFKSARKQRQLVDMFRSLIKVNNDGILITQNDQIIFFNDKMKQIFDVPPFPKESQSTNSNDESAKANESKAQTVKINCGVDQDVIEERTDRQLIEQDSNIKRKQRNSQRKNNLTAGNNEAEKYQKDPTSTKMPHIDQSNQQFANFNNSSNQDDIELNASHNNLNDQDEKNYPNKQIDKIQRNRKVDIQEKFNKNNQNLIEFWIKEKIQKALAQTLPSQENQQQYAPSSQNSRTIYNLISQSLWQYLTFFMKQQKEQSKTTSGRYMQQDNSEEGFYYTFKQIKSGESRHQFKKLQIFSKMVDCGSGEQGHLVMTTIRDMSHWLELERQKTSSTLKTIAFAQAAHEFRNPLNGIQASLSLLNDKIDHLKCGKYYQIAMDCTNLMVYLVRDIMDFSQIEAKSFILNISECKVIAALEECISMFKFKAIEKGLNLGLDYESLHQCLPDVLLIDKNRLKQIIINLVSNAIKYTQVGHVIIKGSIDRRKKLIQIIVQDSGVGMTKNQVKNLFTNFVKIMDNRELNKDGVGLGLTISKNLAQAFGGDLLVESKVGAGSFFILSLPFSKQTMIKPPVSAITISQQDNTTESTPSMRLKKRGGKKSAMTGEQTPDNKRSSSVKKD